MLGYIRYLNANENQPFGGFSFYMQKAMFRHIFFTCKKISSALILG